MSGAMLTGHHTVAGRRPENQDAVLAQQLADGRELLAVADGMGGHAAGAEASRLALETLRRELDQGTSLREAVASANVAVHHAAASNPLWSGMGTTLVVLLKSGGSYFIASVGDSRAYHVTYEAIRQVTRDHSFVAEAVSAGRLSVEQANATRWRNALTRALGTDPVIEVDVFGPFEAEPPHAILLTSDGLHQHVAEETMHELVRSAPDAATAVRRLTSAAYGAGSSDNISAVLAVFGRRPQASQRDAHRADEPGRSSARGHRRRGRLRRRRIIELVIAAAALIMVIAVVMRAL